MNKDKVRVVVFVSSGLVVDCITDSPNEIEYLVVDSDPSALDKSVLTLMEGPSRDLPFDEICCLVSSYGNSVYKDKEKVNEIYAVRESRFNGRNFHVI